MAKASIQSSLLSDKDDHSVVLQWAEQMQLKFGNSLNAPNTVLPTSYKVDVVRNELGILKQIWESLTLERKSEFSNKYGYIADLMYVRVNEFALGALVNFWDPTNRCFTFGMMDLVPTLEEYRTLLNIPRMVKDQTYCFNPQQTAKRVLSKFLVNVRANEIQKYMKTNGDEESISMNYLIELAKSHITDEKGLTLLALCIYGAVIFPKTKGSIDGRIVKLFFSLELGVNPIMTILAETMRSLNFCQTKKKGTLRCCTPLLYVWMHSHIQCPKDFRCPIIHGSSWNTTRNTVREFSAVSWDIKYPTRDTWISFFANMKQENIIWKAHWMPLKPMTYRCGNYNSVPLLGPWGCIHYFPLLALRQLWFKQFIPIVHNIEDSEFSYDQPGGNDKKRHAVNAWKAVRKINDKGHCQGTTREYDAWRRGRCITRPEVNTSEINVSPQIMDEYQKLREKNGKLDQENERLQKEVNQWMDYAIRMKTELEETKTSVKDQLILQRDYEMLDQQARQSSKENRSLRNERATNQESINSCNKRIDDLEEGKRWLLELINDLTCTINKQQTQICEFEEGNRSLGITIDSLHTKIVEQLEDYDILKRYAESRDSQLNAFHRAGEKILAKNDELKKECDCLRQDYEIMKNDFNRVLGQVDFTLNTMRMMARRARGYTEWAYELRRSISPMHPDAEELYEFLGMICKDLGRFGRFH